MRRLPIIPDWQCQQTGDCCRATPAIRMHAKELEAILAVAGGHTVGIGDVIPLNDEGFLELKAGPCRYLQGNACTVYEVRPFSCRRFQCHRAPGEPFDASGPLGCRNLSERLAQSRETRHAYKLNQRKAQRWALRHGWTGQE